jgi:GNAT superfamily N-acetyltransferase
MNRSGELHSLVAVNDDGDVMGHCALKFSAQRKDRAELGVLFVRPDYRKQGLGAALWKATIDLGRDLNLDSIYARSVTGHRASQSMAEHNGFNDFALTLALFPRAVDLKMMGGLLKDKMSGMFQWLKLKQPRARTVYSPPRYVDIILELYRRAEIPVTMGDAGTVIQNATPPIYNVHRIAILNVGIVEIGAIGRSTEAAMNWLDVNFRRLCREKMDVVFLYLNFEEPNSIEIVEHCTQRGFIFSGVAPDAFSGGDAILLQYLNLPENPFANLIVWTETAALLRDFIQEEWRTLETSQVE